MLYSPLSPIGIFDSGLGGLSVVKTIQELLPNEDIIYYGDSAHAPYGTKKVDDVITLSETIVKKMIAMGVKAIVIACNTATSAAAEYLREKYTIPILGLEPAIKPAINKYPKGQILVLATEMTLNEKKFNSLVKTMGAKDHIVKCCASKLVPLVERASFTKTEVDAVLDQIVPNHKDTYDAVVLGCTHFLFLSPIIHQYFNNEIECFDGNVGITLHLKERLTAMHMLNPKEEQGKLTLYNSAGQDMIALSRQILEIKE